VEPVYNKDEYKEGIKYLNSLVTEGLLDPSTFTQDTPQLKQIFENPDVAILGALPAGGPNTFADMTNSTRFHDYAVVPPLKGPDGVQLSWYDPYGYFNQPNCWVITSACENPDIAFRFGDVFFSEEISMWGRLGEPGTDYIPNPGKTAVDGGEALFEAVLVYGSEQQSHWQNRNPYYNFFDNKGAASENPYELQDFLWNSMMEYKPFVPAAENCIPDLSYTPEEASELNSINTSLEQYIDETRIQFITSGNIDEAWDGYLAELDTIGAPRVTEIKQAAYDRFMNS
jgi:putative aldouronate transport system substrate-binding protein